MLYYLYDYLFNIGSIQKKAEIVAGPVPASATITDYPSGGTKLNQIIYTGGEMSVTFWVYVSGRSQMNTVNKRHIFHIGTDAAGASGNVLGVMLGNGADNALYVYNSGESSTFSLQTFATTNSAVESSGRCHITNFEYGRWVNVAIVLNNNICDVYIDGKLSRSCVMPQQFQVPSATSPDVQVFTLKKELGSNNNVSWSGSLASLTLYNYALSPDETYRIYFAGPSGSSGDLWTAIKSFFGAGAKVAASLPSVDYTGAL